MGWLGFVVITKTCGKCGEPKELTHFSPMPSCSDGVRGTCKKCASIWATNWLKRRKEAVWGRMKHFTNVARNGAKQRGLSFNLSVEFLVRKYEHQKGLCAISGLPFRLDDDSPFFRTYHFRLSPYLPSLDRKDSQKGYTKNNVHFILLALNLGKNDWPLGTLLPIWEAAVKNSAPKAK